MLKINEKKKENSWIYNITDGSNNNIIIRKYNNNMNNLKEVYVYLIGFKH